MKWILKPYVWWSLWVALVLLGCLIIGLKNGPS